MIARVFGGEGVIGNFFSSALFRSNGWPWRQMGEGGFNHKRRSSVNFGDKTFLAENVCMKN